MLQRLFLFPTIFTVMLLSFAVQADGTIKDKPITSNPYLDALPSWSATLNKFVNSNGQVDFVSLSKDTSELRHFVSAIEQVSPMSNPDLFPNPDAVLAYHVNAYNALAMLGVIERDIPDNFSSLFKRASFFKFRKVTIGGQKTDLYNYENKVIRPLGEARMHFLLNCMVKDCPRLPTKVVTEETVEQDLQAASIEFFNKPKHILIDEEKEQLHLSGIMKFYTKDYVASGEKQDLIAYVNQYRDDKIPQNYKVKFIKYDWTVNQQGL